MVKAAPSREFYNFNGWFDGTNTYFPGATYLTQSSNIIFTAQWQGKIFRVSYDFNGGAATGKPRSSLGVVKHDCALSLAKALSYGSTPGSTL